VHEPPGARGALRCRRGLVARGGGCL